MMRYLRALWRITFAPVYRRLFGRYFEAILSEVKAIREELYHDIAGINTRQGQVNSEVLARLDELDQNVRTVIAAGWDDKALARRMAALEDRLGQDGSPVAFGSEPESGSQE